MALATLFSIMNMDKEQLKQALEELFRNGEIEIQLRPIRKSGIMYICPIVLIDGGEVFTGEPV